MRTRDTATECLVIGAGTAGLMAAATAAESRMTLVLNKGMAASYWSSGCVDVIGRVEGQYVACPADGLRALVGANPTHPYGVIAGGDPDAAVSLVERAIEQFKVFTGHAYEGTLRSNVWLITSLGTLRPTCCAPAAVMRGHVGALRDATTALVGFRGFGGFDPRYVRALLRVNMRAWGGAPLDLAAHSVAIGERTAVEAAEVSEYLKTDVGLAQVTREVAAVSRGCSHVGFPSLGDCATSERLQQLGEALGVTVFDIPVPFSGAGQRLRDLLLAGHSFEVVDGVRVRTLETADGSCTAARGDRWSVAADAFVLATGGVLSGGITIVDGRAVEPLTGTALGLVHGVPRAVGVRVDHDLSLILQGDRTVRNLFACGSVLGNYDPVAELSGHGVCIATGYAAGQEAARYGR